MIQAQELRIGNYISVEGKIRQVSMISNETSQVNLSAVDAKESKATHSTVCTLASAQSVVLTDDILQQCNFVYRNYFKFRQLVTGIDEKRSEMKIDRDYNIIDFMRRPMVKKVTSLHQLQNIYFMLKGEELLFSETQMATNNQQA